MQKVNLFKMLFKGETDFEVMQGGVTEQLAVSCPTKPC